MVRVLGTCRPLKSMTFKGTSNVAPNRAHLSRIAHLIWGFVLEIQLLPQDFIGIAAFTEILFHT